MTGNFNPILIPTEITAVIKLAQNTIEPKLQPGVVLNDVCGATECTIMTDKKLLLQVLMNLLVNASKFTAKGAITFGYEVYDEELFFFVKDTGSGLSPEQKQRITDLFENNDTISPGLGYGLPMANTIVKKLGGRIGVESRGSGRGSSFWFTVPNAVPSAETAAPTEAPAAVEQVAEKKASDRPTILVAEDNNSNYLLVYTILKKKYEVMRAVDGMEAVEMFKEHNPDLILMDLNMPRMDGYEATREIRKISATVPIIAATAYAFVTDRQRILDNGFNGYVSKPINVARLDKEINSCLFPDSQQ